MCSYIVQKADIYGSGKGATGWFSVTQANVCMDHPFHANLDDALLIDFVNPGMGVAARVAVELSAESARALVTAIEAALAEGHDHGIVPAAAVVSVGS